MKAHLLVADTGTTHADGSFSLLKAGLCTVGIHKDQPIGIEATVAFWVRGEARDAGDHKFMLRLVDAQDTDAIPPAEGGIHLASEGGYGGRALLQVSMPLPSFGTYRFVLSVDEKVEDTWPIHVFQVASKEPTPTKG